MHVVGHDELLLTLLALNVETVAGDGGAGETLAQILRLPQQARPALGPRVKQAGFRGLSIAVRPAPLRPIGRRRSDGAKKQNQTEASGHVERVTNCAPLPQCGAALKNSGCGRLWPSTTRPQAASLPHNSLLLDRDEPRSHDRSLRTAAAASALCRGFRARGWRRSRDRK